MRHDKADIIYNDNFIDEVEATFKASKPFMKYLCFALDVPFQNSCDNIDIEIKKH